MTDMAARAVRVEDLEPRAPTPVRRLDLYLGLAAAALACAVYLGALLTGLALPPGLSVALFTAAPLCAAFALAMLLWRPRRAQDEALRWFTSGLVVGVTAMVLQLISFPAVAPRGGVLGTGNQSSAALYLLFHLWLAVCAACGAFEVPPRWRRPVTAAGVTLAFLLALDLVPLPRLLSPAMTFSPVLVGAEWVLAAVMAACTVAWVLRVGRMPVALRAWVGVALSLATYDVVLNALGGARFEPVWWASLSLRVATYVVLAGGVLWSVLVELRDLDRYSAEELHRRESQLSRSLTETRRLLRCAEDLARAVTSEDVATILSADIVAMTGLPRVAVVARQSSGGLRALGTAGYDGELATWAHQIDWDAPLPAARAVLTGESVFLATEQEVRNHFPALASTPLAPAQALAALPLVVRGQAMGAVVVWDTAPVQWTPAARELIAGLAAQGGQALARARAYEAAAVAAATLQASLLPSSLPRRDDLDLAARYVPGESGHGGGEGVGGDWYDCVEVDEHRVALVVGDVMGKGLHAAAVMGQMRTTLRALTAIDPSPRAVLAALDRVTRDLDDDEIATVVYVLLDLRTGRAEVGRAGHPPPLLATATGEVTLLDEGGSRPLGAPGGSWAESTFEVPAGSVLVLFSDGLVENRRTGLGQGLAQLTTALTALVAASGEGAGGEAGGGAADALATGLMTRVGGRRRDDDITLLVVRPLLPVEDARAGPEVAAATSTATSTPTSTPTSTFTSTGGGATVAATEADAAATETGTGTGRSAATRGSERRVRACHRLGRETARMRNLG